MGREIRYVESKKTRTWRC